jgi:hypothetical protein
MSSLLVSKPFGVTAIRGFAADRQSFAMQNLSVFTC